MCSIPVKDDEDNILCTVKFEDNLTKKDVPDYVNMNCKIGLVKYPGIRYPGWYVLCYYDKYYPPRSYGEVISPREAYMICLRSNKLDLAEKLGINIPEKMVEVI